MTITSSTRSSVATTTRSTAYPQTIEIKATVNNPVVDVVSQLTEEQRREVAEDYIEQHPDVLDDEPDEDSALAAWERWDRDGRAGYEARWRSWTTRRDEALADASG